MVLCQLLGQMKVTNFKAPEESVFVGRGKMPCIAALHKFNKGWLFPLKGVLIFIGVAFRAPDWTCSCRQHLQADVSRRFRLFTHSQPIRVFQP